jgi:cob(I)alamin adenosyltransferase
MNTSDSNTSDFNTNDLSILNLHNNTSPALAYALLQAKGTTDKGGNSQYSDYIPKLDETGRLDKSFFENVEINIKLPPASKYYYIDASAAGSSDQNGSIQNPYADLNKALEGNSGKSVSFIFRPGTYTGLQVIKDLTDSIVITSDGTGAVIIENLKLGDSTDTTGNVFIKDIQIDELQVATNSNLMAHVYVLSSNGHFNSKISQIDGASSTFYLYTDAYSEIGQYSIDIERTFLTISTDNISLSDETNTPLTNKLKSVDNSIVGLDEKIDDHKNNKRNPHETTADQVGALPITGGCVTNDIYILKEGEEAKKLATEEYVSSAYNIDISKHNTSESAHENRFSNYLPRTDFDIGYNELDSNIQEHKSDQSNPHKTKLSSVLPEESSLYSRLILDSGDLSINKYSPVPNTITLTNGGFSVSHSDYVNILKPNSIGTGTKFKLYPYPRLNENGTRSYFYFSQDIPDSEIIPLSSSWLLNRVYLLIIDNPSIIRLVPNVANISESEHILFEATTGELGSFNNYTGEIRNNRFFSDSNIELVANYNESTISNTVITSTDLNTSEILDYVGRFSTNLTQVSEKLEEVRSTATTNSSNIEILNQEITGLDETLDEKTEEINNRLDALEGAIIPGGDLPVTTEKARTLIDDSGNTSVFILRDGTTYSLNMTIAGGFNYTFATCDQIAPINAKVETLETDTNQLESCIAFLCNKFDITSDNVSRLSVEINNKASSVEVNALASTVNNLYGCVGEVTSDISALSSTLTSTQERVTATEESLLTLSNTLTSTQERITATEESLTAINTALAPLNAHISNQENPHNVTAAQIGVYTTTEADSIFATKKQINELSALNIMYDSKETIHDAVSFNTALILQLEQNRLRLTDSADSSKIWQLQVTNGELSVVLVTDESTES